MPLYFKIKHIFLKYFSGPEALNNKFCDFWFRSQICGPPGSIKNDAANFEFSCIHIFMIIISFWYSWFHFWPGLVILPASILMMIINFWPSWFPFWFLKITIKNYWISQFYFKSWINNYIILILLVPFLLILI